MPELPEAETIIRDLRPSLLGRRIVSFEVFWPNTLIPRDEALFRRTLVGRVITDIERRGKYIVTHLSDGVHLLTHLKMTGRLILRSPELAVERSCTAIIEFDQGLQLRLVDLRRFGRLYLADDNLLQRILSTLGPEPLSEAFTPEVLEQRLGHRRARIKMMLMDQAVVAGLGNIYSDEALFHAGIHPMRACNALKTEDWQHLHRGIIEILAQGLANRGTSFRDYLDGYGRPGANQSFLKVYKRAGQPCYRCGTPIQRLKFSSRHTHYCPQCQR